MRAHERVSEIHTAGHDPDPDRDVGLSADAGAFEGFGWLLSETWSSEGGDIPVGVAALAHEDDLSGALDPFEKPDLAAFFDLPDAGEEVRPRQRRVNKVTEEDFDSEEDRWAFRTIKQRVDGLFSDKTPQETKLESVRWLFGQGEDDMGLTMDVCCGTLSARKHIVHIRLHYEFWKRWVIFPFEFPFTTSPLPTGLRHEIRYETVQAGIAADEGVYLAQEAWIRPGITTAELLLNASGKESAEEIPSYMRELLSLLESHHILSCRMDNWYLTGRNPMLAYEEAVASGRDPRAATPCWSRFWPKHD